MCDAGIVDTYLLKEWGLKFTLNAVLTVLRVDQVGYSYYCTHIGSTAASVWVANYSYFLCVLDADYYGKEVWRSETSEGEQELG